MHLLIGVVASFLPQRYRSALSVSAPAAAISGVAQLLFCLGALIYRYFTFTNNRLFADMNVMQKAGQRGGEAVIMGSGLLLLMEYLIQPLTIVLCYFAFEGLVRLVAAIITQEIVPTLPLYLVLLQQQKLHAIRCERALGERIIDEVRFVESSPCGLRIASCRPKEGWNKLITVAYQDELYEVAAAQEGNPPRPFVYLLRRKPDHKVIRGIHHYDPTEALADVRRQEN
ncbi:MAG TPA: hypothetical protein VK699_00580 [Terriglobales bacterium]|nr:hypothetical protein [Terriglobales bacterium]